MVIARLFREVLRAHDDNVAYLHHHALSDPSHATTCPRTPQRSSYRMVYSFVAERSERVTFLGLWVRAGYGCKDMLYRNTYHLASV